MLKICVCGWHLEKFDALYKVLWKLHHENDIPVHIVSNKDSRWLKVFDLPYSYRDNYGLEFGAYDYYLRNIWDGESDVLFMHDDIEFKQYMRKYELLPPERIFDGFKSLKIDQGYVFSSRKEDVFNDGKHGRMFYCSWRVLTAWRDKIKDGATLCDVSNNGQTGIGSNLGIERFDDFMKELKPYKVRENLYIPAIDMKWRGNEYPILREGEHHANFQASIVN